MNGLQKRSKLRLFAESILVMKQLATGTYFGTKKTARKLHDLLLTDVEFDGREEVPWHYHEQAYFSCFLEGQLTEVNKKEKIACTPGTILFNNSEEPHRNTDHSPYTRHFHIEIGDSWFAKYELDRSLLQGSMQIDQPVIAGQLRSIYREFRTGDPASGLAMEGLLLQTMAMLLRRTTRSKNGIPAWVNTVREIIHEQYAENLSLAYLAQTAGIHPVHLSQKFAAYFHAGFGDYLRQVRIEKAIALLQEKRLGMAEIAYSCGFADQSHFIRCFKAQFRTTPARFKNKGWEA